MIAAAVRRCAINDAEVEYAEVEYSDLLGISVYVYLSLWEDVVGESVGGEYHGVYFLVHAAVDGEELDSSCDQL